MSAILGYVIADLNVGTTIHVAGDHCIRNRPEDLTDDIRKQFSDENRGYTYQPVYDDATDPIGAAERAVARWQVKADAVNEHVAIARAVRPRTLESVQHEAIVADAARAPNDQLAAAKGRLAELRSPTPAPARALVW